MDIASSLRPDCELSVICECGVGDELSISKSVNGESENEGSFSSKSKFFCVRVRMCVSAWVRVCVEETPLIGVDFTTFGADIHGYGWAPSKMVRALTSDPRYVAVKARMGQFEKPKGAVSICPSKFYLWTGV